MGMNVKDLSLALLRPSFFNHSLVMWPNKIEFHCDWYYFGAVLCTFMYFLSIFLQHFFDCATKIVCSFLCYFLKNYEFGRTSKIWEQATALACVI